MKSQFRKGRFVPLNFWREPRRNFGLVKRYGKLLDITYMVGRGDVRGVVGSPEWHFLHPTGRPPLSTLDTLDHSRSSGRTPDFVLLNITLVYGVLYYRMDVDNVTSYTRGQPRTWEPGGLWTMVTSDRRWEILKYNPLCVRQKTLVRPLVYGESLLL